VKVAGSKIPIERYIFMQNQNPQHRASSIGARHLASREGRDLQRECTCPVCGRVIDQKGLAAAFPFAQRMVTRDSYLRIRGLIATKNREGAR
jgi:hypothetical protein